VAQKVNLGNLGVRNAMRPKERALPFLGVLGCATLGDSWRKRGFAGVDRYAIVTLPEDVLLEVSVLNSSTPRKLCYWKDQRSIHASHRDPCWNLVFRD